MKKLLRSLSFTLATIMAVLFLSVNPVSVDAYSHKAHPCNTSSSTITANTTSTFHYTHDPRKNCKAMQDIKVDPSAIYGFSPRSDSVGLGAYAAYDWTDAEVVAKAKASRTEYHQQFESMYQLWEDMKNEGASTEEIARAVSKMRNDIRIASYKDDPEGLATLKERNLAKYGNEDGPTPEYLYNKCGSWEEVLYSAFSSNPGMDACLGLYDEQYNHLLLVGEVTDHTYDDGVVVKEATHHHDGKIVYTCTACGTQITKTIPALKNSKHHK